MHAPILTRLDARDRALFLRWVIRETHAPAHRWLWTALTHLGDAATTMMLALLPALLPRLSPGAVPTLDRIGWTALGTLVVSHLLVQLVKRTVGRPRPRLGTACAAWAAEPDRFSFPSGHAAAAMSIAITYAAAAPALVAPLLLVGFLVGVSRVCLGVHYPGDVLMGQALAVSTGVVILLA